MGVVCTDGSPETSGGPSDLEFRVREFNYVGSVLDPAVDIFSPNTIPGMESHVRLWVAMISEFLESVQSTPVIRALRANGRDSNSNRYQVRLHDERLSAALEFFFTDARDPDGLNLDWLCEAISRMARMKLESAAVRGYAKLLYDVSLQPGAKRQHKLHVPTGRARPKSARARDTDRTYRAGRIAAQRMAANA